MNEQSRRYQETEEEEDRWDARNDRIGYLLIFCVAVCVTSFVITLFSGFFGGDTVKNVVRHHATETCEEHGGLDKIETFGLFGIDMQDSYRVVCRDGFKVSYWKIQD